MNAKRMRTIGVALVATLSFLMSGEALAQASRTWVSGVGDDANPCSRTAPCKTFAGAISKTAAGGEINALDPGGYGSVTITKAITIDGGPGIAGILAAGVNGIVVSAGINDVVRLRNLDINGFGSGVNGIRFIGGKALEVHNVQIFQFSAQGISFEVPAGFASFLSVTESRLENNAAGAVWITGAGTPIASLERVQMVGGQRGLRADDGSTVHVKDSSAGNLSANGFVAVGTSRAVTMMLDRCVAFNGGGGVFSGTLATVFISDTTITGNGTGLVVSGGQIVSSGNNTVQGNGVNGAPTSTPGRI